MRLYGGGGKGRKIKCPCRENMKPLRWGKKNTKRKRGNVL